MLREREYYLDGHCGKLTSNFNVIFGDNGGSPAVVVHQSQLAKVTALQHL